MYIYAYQVFDTFITAPAFYSHGRWFRTGFEPYNDRFVWDIFHENECEYMSSGMWYHIVWEVGEWAFYLMVPSDEYVTFVE